MRTTLIRTLIVISLLMHSLTGQGQSPSYNRSTSQIPEPLFIINSSIIGNGLITKLDPKKITETIVYKGQDGPGALKNITSAGIISITYDGQINSKSFTELGVQHGLQGPLMFIINGHKLNAAQIASLRIAPEAIGQIQIARAPSDTSKTTVIIQLAQAKTNSQKAAPGTIMIR